MFTLDLAPPTIAWEGMTPALSGGGCDGSCFLYTWKAEGRPEAARSKGGFGLSAGLSAIRCVKSTNDCCSSAVPSSQWLSWLSGEDAPEMCSTSPPDGPLDPGCRLDWSSSGRTCCGNGGGGKVDKYWLLLRSSLMSCCVVNVSSSWSTSRSSSSVRRLVEGAEGIGSGLGSQKWPGLSRAAAVRSKPEMGEGIGPATSAATESSKRESIAFSTKTQTKQTRDREEWVRQVYNSWLNISVFDFLVFALMSSRRKKSALIKCI